MYLFYMSCVDEGSCSHRLTTLAHLKKDKSLLYVVVKEMAF